MPTPVFPTAPPHPIETIDEGTSSGRSLDRLRVPGGWLYRAVEWHPESPYDAPTPYGVGLCFVPDPTAGA